MQILHKKDGNKGFFHIGDEKNAGYQLVSAAVEYARENAIRIIPLCPFANSVFKKKSELGDVLFTH